MKKVLIISMIFLLIFAFAYNVYGYDAGEVTSALSGGNPGTMGTSVQTILGVILDVIRIVGMGIALIMVLAFGIKYMVSMPGERAQMMKQSMVYLLGAVLLFGASFLVGLVADIVESSTEV